MKSLFVLLLWACAISAPAAQARPALVRVAAASDLRFALDEIVAAYRRQAPSVRVEVTYGSSGTLHAQILQGAPFDLFLSADAGYPRDLVSRGKVDGAALFTYAIGRLVLWAPLTSPVDVANGMDALLGDRVRHIAIANPLHAPYGKAAESAMRAARIWDVVQAKLVLGENIAQAAQFTESGAAEVGVIARSIAWAPALRAKGRYWEVPPTLYPVMEQSGIVLRNARNGQAATAFANYLQTDEAGGLLVRHGFELPGVTR